MRLLPLDSLRGIAALSVVFYHCLLVFPAGFALLFARGVPITQSRDWVAGLLTLSPPSLLWSGREAVLLFFVLSGFVLALPYFAGTPPRYAAFAMKRVVRLLLPCMAVVLLSAAAALLIPQVSRPGLSPWPAMTWSQPVTGWTLLQHLFLLDDLFPLNNVLWTLRYELHASLAFPLLVMLAKLKLPAAAVLALTLMAVGVAEARLAGTVFLGVLTAVPHFLAGILLARHRLAVLERLTTAGLVTRIALWSLCYLLLSIRWLLPLPGALCDLANGLGAALLIALVLSSARAQALLSLRPLVWLGAISYSLYLLHVPIIVAALHLAPPEVPAAAVLAGAVPLSLLAAAALHRAVELPSIRWGRQLAAWLAPAPERLGAQRPPLPPCPSHGALPALGRRTPL